LWFVNNYELEQRVLGYLAKYQEKYEIEIYAFVILGNHYHLLARFPKLNRSSFLRDFNSRFTLAVSCTVKHYPGGHLWGRRSSPQLLPLNEDVRHYFHYCALQAVSAGLTERISEYPGYNSFGDAVYCREKTYKVVDWTDYNNRRRSNKNLGIKDCTDEYKLKYSRLPGLEHLSQNEYAETLLKELEEKRSVIIAERKKEEKGFVGPKALRKTRPGALPRNTKTGGFRPVVLSCCRETRNQFLEWYWGIVELYMEASEKYRNGDRNAVFPANTYKPPGPFVAA
jgi:REP element-mobilizing transposase RayT